MNMLERDKGHAPDGGLSQSRHWGQNNSLLIETVIIRPHIDEYIALYMREE